MHNEKLVKLIFSVRKLKAGLLYRKCMTMVVSLVAILNDQA